MGGAGEEKVKKNRCEMTQMRLHFPTHLDSFPNVNKISYSVDGDDGEIWSVDGGELSWAEMWCR